MAVLQEQGPRQFPTSICGCRSRTLEDRVDAFRTALEALGGCVVGLVDRSGARDYVAGQIAGHSAVASNAAFLRECGIVGLAGVMADLQDPAEARQACATVDVGITSAHFALANTGTLVMMASAEEARLVSLLPPKHIAVVPVSRLLADLDELFSPGAHARRSDQRHGLHHRPKPHRRHRADSRCAAWHGPGEIHVVLVDDPVTESRWRASHNLF